jgi:hypothetical protein
MLHDDMGSRAKSATCLMKLLGEWESLLIISISCFEIYESINGDIVKETHGNETDGYP